MPVQHSKALFVECGMNKWSKAGGPHVHGRLREWINFFDKAGGNLQAGGGLGKGQVPKMSANVRIIFT